MEINNKSFGTLLFIGNHQGSVTKMGMCCCKLLPQYQASAFKVWFMTSVDLWQKHNKIKYCEQIIYSIHMIVLAVIL